MGGVDLTGASVSPSCPQFLTPPMPHRGLSPLVDSGHLWAKQPCVSSSRTADCQSHPPTERFLLRSPTSVTRRRRGARAGTHLPSRCSVVSLTPRAWNWPCWECLERRNLANMANRGFSLFPRGRAVNSSAAQYCTRGTAGEEGNRLFSPGGSQPGAHLLAPLLPFTPVHVRYQTPR